MSTSINHHWIPHPGEYIKEELEARAWSQRDLAFILGCPEQAINVIIAGKRGISPDMAKALGHAFDVNPEFFSNLQRAFDLANAHEPNAGIAKRARIQSAYPVREMIKRGWLEDTDAPMLEVQLARFFEVSNIDDVPHLPHAAKKTYYDKVPPEQLAWLFRVRQIAKSFTVSEYSEHLLKEMIPQLKKLLIEPPAAVSEIPLMLKKCGVRFIIVESLPKSKIDGVCFWLDKNNPVIGMSLRHDRIDNFWFVLRHEIEHILQKHGQQQEMIDSDLCDTMDGSTTAEERLANNAASDFCISKEEMNSFITQKSPFFYEKDIIALAKTMKIHPGLVVGQLHAKTKKYEMFRKYLVKIRSYVLQEAMQDGWGKTFPVTL